MPSIKGFHMKDGKPTKETLEKLKDTGAFQIANQLESAGVPKKEEKEKI